MDAMAVRPGAVVVRGYRPGPGVAGLGRALAVARRGGAVQAVVLAPTGPGDAVVLAPTAKQDFANLHKIDTWVADEWFVAADGSVYLGPGRVEENGRLTVLPHAPRPGLDRFLVGGDGQPVPAQAAGPPPMTGLGVTQVARRTELRWVSWAGQHVQVGLDLPVRTRFERADDLLRLVGAASLDRAVLTRLGLGFYRPDTEAARRRAVQALGGGPLADGDAVLVWQVALLDVFNDGHARAVLAKASAKAGLSFGDGEGMADAAPRPDEDFDLFEPRPIQPPPIQPPPSVDLFGMALQRDVPAVMALAAAHAAVHDLHGRGLPASAQAMVSQARQNLAEFAPPPAPVVSSGGFGEVWPGGFGDGVRLFRRGGVWHVWVGLEPDVGVMDGLAVREGVVVVHGHGRGGGVAASAGLGRAVAVARRGGAVEAVLLACEQIAAQEFADFYGLDTWAIAELVFVAWDGSVFLGQGRVDERGGLTVSPQALRRGMDKFVVGGGGRPVAPDAAGRPPIMGLSLADVADLLKQNPNLVWQRRLGQNMSAPDAGTPTSQAAEDGGGPAVSGVVAGQSTPAHVSQQETSAPTSHLPWDMIHEDDHEAIVEVPAGLEVYHYSVVSPEIIFPNGVRPRSYENRVTVWSHMKAPGNPPSQYVSTSVNPDLAYNNRRYRYTIRSSASGIEAHATTIAQGHSYAYGHEGEVSYPGGIQPHEIREVLDRHAGTVMHNPRFVPPGVRELFGPVAAEQYAGVSLGHDSGFVLSQLVDALARMAGALSVSAFSALAGRIGVERGIGARNRLRRLRRPTSDVEVDDRRELLDVAYLAARVFGLEALTAERLTDVRRLSHVRLPEGGPRLSSWVHFEALIRDLRGDATASPQRPVDPVEVRLLVDLIAPAKQAKKRAVVHRQVNVEDLRREWARVQRDVAAVRGQRSLTSMSARVWWWGDDADSVPPPMAATADRVVWARHGEPLVIAYRADPTGMPLSHSGPPLVTGATPLAAAMVLAVRELRNLPDSRLGEGPLVLMPVVEPGNANSLADFANDLTRLGVQVVAFDSDGKVTTGSVPTPTPARLRREALAAWSAAGTWPESRTLLDRHADILRHDRVRAQLVVQLEEVDPNNDRLAAQVAIIELSRQGLTDFAYEYLNERDPNRRRELLLQQLITAPPGLSKTLVNLSRGAAVLPAEHTDLAMIRAVGYAMDSRLEEGLRVVAENWAQLPPSVAADWVNWLTTLADHHPVYGMELGALVRGIQPVRGDVDIISTSAPDGDSTEGGAASVRAPQAQQPEQASSAAGERVGSVGNTDRMVYLARLPGAVLPEAVVSVLRAGRVGRTRADLAAQVDSVRAWAAALATRVREAVPRESAEEWSANAAWEAFVTALEDVSGRVGEATEQTLPIVRDEFVMALAAYDWAAHQLRPMGMHEVLPDVESLLGPVDTAAMPVSDAGTPTSQAAAGRKSAGMDPHPRRGRFAYPTDPTAPHPARAHDQTNDGGDPLANDLVTELWDSPSGSRSDGRAALRSLLEVAASGEPLGVGEALELLVGLAGRVGVVDGGVPALDRIRRLGDAAGLIRGLQVGTVDVTSLTQMVVLAQLAAPLGAGRAWVERESLARLAHRLGLVGEQSVTRLWRLVGIAVEQFGVDGVSWRRLGFLAGVAELLAPLSEGADIDGGMIVDRVAELAGEGGSAPALSTVADQALQTRVVGEPMTSERLGQWVGAATPMPGPPMPGPPATPAQLIDWYRSTPRPAGGPVVLDAAQGTRMLAAYDAAVAELDVRVDALPADADAGRLSRALRERMRQRLAGPPSAVGVAALDREHRALSDLLEQANTAGDAANRVEQAGLAASRDLAATPAPRLALTPPDAPTTPTDPMLTGKAEAPGADLPTRRPYEIQWTPTSGTPQQRGARLADLRRRYLTAKDPDQRRTALHEAVAEHPTSDWMPLAQLVQANAANDVDHADAAILHAIADLLRNTDPTSEQITAAATQLEVARGNLPRGAVGAWRGQLIALAQGHPAESALEALIQTLALPPSSAHQASPLATTSPDPIPSATPTTTPNELSAGMASPTLAASQDFSHQYATELNKPATRQEVDRRTGNADAPIGPHLLTPEAHRAYLDLDAINHGDAGDAFLEAKDNQSRRSALLVALGEASPALVAALARLAKARAATDPDHVDAEVLELLSDVLSNGGAVSEGTRGIPGLTGAAKWDWMTSVRSLKEQFPQLSGPLQAWQEHLEPCV